MEEERVDSEEMIRRIMEIGFSRENAIVGLEVTGGNDPDHAVEYLMQILPIQEEDIPKQASARGLGESVSLLHDPGFPIRPAAITTILPPLNPAPIDRARKQEPSPPISSVQSSSQSSLQANTHVRPLFSQGISAISPPADSESSHPSETSRIPMKPEPRPDQLLPVIAPPDSVSEVSQFLQPQGQSQPQLPNATRANTVRPASIESGQTEGAPGLNRPIEVPEGPIQVTSSNAWVFKDIDLWDDAANGDLETFKKHFQGLSIHVDSTNTDGLTLLHISAYYANPDIVGYLLQKKANVHAKCARGNTPLIYSLKGKIDLNPISPQHGQHYVVVIALLESHARLDISNDEGVSPLHLVTLWPNNDVDLLETFLDMGAIVQQSDHQGQTPFHFAADNGNLLAVRKLHSNNAVLSATDFSGQSALHLAAAQGHQKVVEFLLTAGADPNLQDLDGETPLHRACHNGRYSVVSSLLRASADVHVFSKKNKTAFQVAKEKQHTDILPLFYDRFQASADASKPTNIAQSQLQSPTFTRNPSQGNAMATPLSASASQPTIQTPSQTTPYAATQPPRPSLQVVSTQVPSSPAQPISTSRFTRPLQDFSQPSPRLPQPTPQQVEHITQGITNMNPRVNVPRATPSETQIRVGQKDYTPTTRVSPQNPAAPVTYAPTSTPGFQNTGFNQTPQSPQHANFIQISGLNPTQMSSPATSQAQPIQVSLQDYFPNRPSVPLDFKAVPSPSRPPANHVYQVVDESLGQKLNLNPALKPDERRARSLSQDIVRATSSSAPVSTNIEFSELWLGPLIGSGEFGEVFKGRYRDQTVAIKKLKVLANAESVQRDFFNEVEILRRVSHENICRFIGACLKAPNLCMVSEFCERGNLFELLRTVDVKQNPQLRIAFSIHIARAICYLHENKPQICHRDLKSLNVLVDQAWNAKVTDFGMAKVRQHAYTTNYQTRCGTPAWMAPEVLQGRYSEKADVYSFGVIMWELLTCRPPYAGMSPPQIMHAVERGNPPGPIPHMDYIMYKLSPRYFDAMKSCSHLDPGLRPSFRQIIELLDKRAGSV